MNSSASKTAVFVCTHHSGHINPITSLVSVFQKQGWKVHFFSSPQRQAKIENTGATFHRDHSKFKSLQEAVVAAITHRFQLPLTANVEGEFLFEQILPATVEFLDDGFVERVQNLSPDVLVCDVSSLWGVLTAQILKVPLITSCSCTLFDSASLEPIFGGLRDLPACQKAVRWIQQTYGIEYDALNSYMNESEFLICWSIPSFQPKCRRNDAKVHFYGAALTETIHKDIEQAASVDRELGENSVVKFIEKGRRETAKIIYCTLGTVVGQEKWTLVGKKDGDMVTDFYQQVIQCFGDRSDYRFILSIGPNRKMEDLPDLPGNFFVSHFVPQLVVLNMVDAFITHCGNNGVHEAFFFGCPMLCVPVFGDQHPNAAMIEEMGAGVQIASPYAPAPSPNLDHITSEKLCAKLEEIIVHRKEEIQSSCQAIRAEMAKQHALFHSQGFVEMENFIRATTAVASLDDQDALQPVSPEELVKLASA